MRQKLYGMKFLSLTYFMTMLIIIIGAEFVKDSDPKEKLDKHGQGKQKVVHINQGSPKSSVEKFVKSEGSDKVVKNDASAELHRGKNSKQSSGEDDSDDDDTPETLTPLDDLIKNVTFHQILLAMGPCRSALYVCAYRLAECMDKHVLPHNKALASHLEAQLKRFGQAKKESECAVALNECNAALWKCRVQHYGLQGAALAVANDVVHLRPPAPEEPAAAAAAAHRLRDSEPAGPGHLLGILRQLASLLPAAVTAALFMAVLRRTLHKTRPTPEASRGRNRARRVSTAVRPEPLTDNQPKSD